VSYLYRTKSASGGYPPPPQGGRFYDSILSPILFIYWRARRA